MIVRGYFTARGLRPASAASPIISLTSRSVSRATRRAAQRLIRAADGGHGTSVIPSGRTPRLSVAVYGPGDQIGVDGTMVPTGSVGLAITLTMGRTRYRAHESS